MRIRINRSSGNVFLDLGFKPEEAENLALRASLMTRLERIIREQGWTQREAAVRLGVTQPRISDLARGKIDRFSVDSLQVLLFRSGHRLDVGIRKSRKAAHGRKQTA
jgi:predicted XRE-type DNA-binding protein